MCWRRPFGPGLLARCDPDDRVQAPTGEDLHTSAAAVRVQKGLDMVASGTGSIKVSSSP